MESLPSNLNSEVGNYCLKCSSYIPLENYLQYEPRYLTQFFQDISKNKSWKAQNLQLYNKIEKLNKDQIAKNLIISTENSTISLNIEAS